jgi:hypothetical protein
MKTIWKFTLTSDCIVEMPIGAKILTIQEQRGLPRMWALVDSVALIEKRRFFIYGTGHQIDENIGDYIGMFQLNDGAPVFHVFEVAA